MNVTQLVDEANRQRGIAGDPAAMESNLAQAKQLADQKAAAAAEAAK